ncbi:MAG TPA: replication factor C small subunit [archaeon]|nr:replication factor C small subunit [archaeon]
MELPWIEKYRPEKLSDVVGQKEITSRLENYVKHKTMPNLLFAGQAGIGKTSCAVALAKEMFGDNFTHNFLELNASDDRGIDVVRETIKNFARTLAFNQGFKIIFLDESDALTFDAQQALRRTMERYARTCRFIMSANYSSKIIEPIQSRCVIFRFSQLSSKDIEARIKDVSKKEGVQIDDAAITAIVYVCQGDMRKAINVLQASATTGSKITEKTIYEVSARARPEEIKGMVKLALSGKFLEARTMLDKLMYEYGMSGEDVILQLHREMIEMPEDEVPGKTKIELIDKIGEYNFRMVEGANERVQLEALLAQFLKYKK